MQNLNRKTALQSFSCNEGSGRLQLLQPAARVSDCREAVSSTFFILRRYLSSLPQQRGREQMSLASEQQTMGIATRILI